MTMRYLSVEGCFRWFESTTVKIHHTEGKAKRENPADPHSAAMLVEVHNAFSPLFDHHGKKVKFLAFKVQYDDHVDKTQPYWPLECVMMKSDLCPSQGLSVTAKWIELSHKSSMAIVKYCAWCECQAFQDHARDGTNIYCQQIPPLSLCVGCFSGFTTMIPVNFTWCTCAFE